MTPRQFSEKDKDNILGKTPNAQQAVFRALRLQWLPEMKWTIKQAIKR